MNETVLEIRSVSHFFRKGLTKNCVLHDVNLKVKEGQFVGLVGPSGCGKSVLFRGIVGTHPPKEGEILIFSGQENEVAQKKTKPDRNVGIVYQRYSLFPFLTAVENVAIGLMLDQTSIPSRLFRPLGWRKLRKRHLQEATAMLEKVKLKDHLYKYPAEMSGGMCQRVAIAQAIILKPRILLLDEPFGALDEATRTELQDMLLTLYAENVKAKQKNERPPYTVLMVTHELTEAIRVGDRVVGLSPFWNWKRDFQEFPGSTVVYDKPAPVFLPKQPVDFQAIEEQKDEITRATFDPNYTKNHEEFIHLWDKVSKG
ncbi:MAG: hypothetical protein A2351_02150 [Omnitrophica bacterium RIFOXYB12_FULL_50_7]|nr:MAG: hypothetical protein A2351_02150 [Omnitrophica bacterium RIFOXYB12_FULL_50_7]